MAIMVMEEIEWNKVQLSHDEQITLITEDTMGKHAITCRYANEIWELLVCLWQAGKYDKEEVLRNAYETNNFSNKSYDFNEF